MNKFAKLNTARQLNDEEMLELRGGAAQSCPSGCKQSCMNGCKTACQPGNMNGTGTRVEVPIKIL